MNDRQYFMYEYTVIQGGGGEDAEFEARAHGDLDGDLIQSTFSLGGRVQKASGKLVLTLGQRARTKRSAEPSHSGRDGPCLTSGPAVTLPDGEGAYWGGEIVGAQLRPGLYL
jgi:hypothetical protein